jgi:hypothetical protein
MTCKQCGKEIPAETQHVAYQKVDYVVTERYEGYDIAAHEIPVDAGVFCSDKCLLDYLMGVGA